MTNIYSGEPELDGPYAEDDSPLLAREWPVLDSAALQGGAGEIVRLIEPTTEADPAAVLASLLAAVGVLCNEGPRLEVANNVHRALIWPLIVGRTSSGAKGTSWDVVRRVVNKVDPLLSARITTGLSSGEGLIEAVRDPVGEPDDKDFDEGVSDKRLIVVEPEFAAVLARMGRQGNTLGTVLRTAWDGSPLQLLNRKNSKLTAKAHHIAVIGHVTPGELVAKLDDSDLSGGTVNRYLLILSKRSKLLPDGGNIPEHGLQRAAGIIRTAVAAADAHSTIYQRTPAAETLWRSRYTDLTADRGEGRDGQATARAVPQVLRLALAYALLDAQTEIDAPHLDAALALWAYAEASARYVFGQPGHTQESGEQRKLLDFITTAGGTGVSRSDIYRDCFGKHTTADAIAALLKALIESGDVDQTTDDTTGGRPRTTYRPRSKRKKRTKPPTGENDVETSCAVSAHKGPISPAGGGDSALSAQAMRTKSASKPAGHRDNALSTHSAQAETAIEPPGPVANLCPECGERVPPGMVRHPECFRAKEAQRLIDAAAPSRPCTECGDPVTGRTVMHVHCAAESARRKTAGTAA
jgi:hypothetical protein